MILATLNKKILTFLFLGYGVSTLLVGCASFYDITSNKVIAYQKPNYIDNDFDISGRFMIKATGKNSYGNYTWTKESGVEEILFRSPLGQTSASIRIESNIATLTTNHKTYTGRELDDILSRKFGFVLPIGYLHYWIQGVQIPDIPIQALNNGFSQLGWTILYLDWQDSKHPRIMKCSNGDIEIKMFVEW